MPQYVTILWACTTLVWPTNELPNRTDLKALDQECVMRTDLMERNRPLVWASVFAMRKASRQCGIKPFRSEACKNG